MGSSISIPSSVSIREETRQTAILSESRLVTRQYRRAEIPDERNNLRLRVRFGTDAGALVNGFPSKGGVYSLFCSPMELDFLGLDRFETALPSSDPAEEDALCAKIRLLGAEWWPSLDSLWGGPPLLEEKVRFIGVASPLEEKVRFIGVASQGGVWALETNLEDCSNRQLGRIQNARDMEEKCRQIERFGGTFYADPSECPLLDFKSPVPERTAIHILFADDDASNQTVARNLLTHLGFSQVTTVGDGKEALDFLLAAAEDKSQRKPDIIFLDTEMPVMDGFECARILRREFPYNIDYSNISIVGMAYRNPMLENRERWFAAGMSGFLPLPIQERDLEQMLVRLVLRGRSRISLSGPSIEDVGRDASMMQEE
ncbi:CheY-like superfamily [Achaetomium macrosporum]|uniref:CheY-like superfamily n=1 Tax=Achaetomium macrosporum TaxID=79813 RepID=A0AAN7C069_9PEZI|nr:CheY-like superfamily [Achaetomium macrosporum]